jgi:2-isopropylmalate synthase
MRDGVRSATTSTSSTTPSTRFECLVGDQVLWGVGLDPNIVTASLKAVTSAVNRAR